MKETHYKLKHRVTALFAAAVMLCSMVPSAAFAEESAPQPTEETVQMEQQTEPTETDNGQTDESSPDPGAEVDTPEAEPVQSEETDSSEAPTADEPEQPIIKETPTEEIPASVIGAELYTDLPDAPVGSYIGSEGLPVATGNTKIGISEWPESQLEENSGSYLTVAALDNDGITMTAPLLDGADYAIVPIMAQVEYPADGSSTDFILPDGVTVLDFYGTPAADTAALLYNSYHETSAAVMGVYVQAASDFAAQFVYTDPNGETQTKTLNVTIDRDNTVASPFSDDGIAIYAERPTPSVTSGKITKVEKVNGTWLIWFNNEPSYCCTPGADGQPKNCPPYTYVNTSMVGADQYIPGDHYGNQYRIWGGLTQLSLGMLANTPAVFSAEAPNLPDFCRTIYTDVQMSIIENYPDSTAAAILTESAQALLNGVDTYASARGYYTYIYQPGRAGWQTVAVIGPEIGDDEPNPEPIVQEIYANWEAPAQTASSSFDFSYGVTTDKVQLKTTEKVDGATIEIEPITKSGTIDGGTWNISPADKQTVTTGGHTSDDNYQNNGGAASASWTLHYSVSKTTDSRSGRVGPYTTQDEADAAADSARDSAITELQGEAQRMVDNALASAKAELVNIKFRFDEVNVPYGFEMYWGSNGSKQTIAVPANSNNDGEALMVLDNTCANKPTEMWVSKRDLTNDTELPGATLVIKDADGNIVTTWVSTDEPHRVTGLHFGEPYTLTEIRPADGYALADDIVFRLIQESDEDGNLLEECEVYYLTTKNILFWTFDDWKLLDDATVIMKDDTIKGGQRLADYLYGRGRLGSHITSGNAALVLQTLPQARAVLTARDWDRFGRRVNKGAKGIPQLVRINGYYNVGSIFDVSMTYGNKPYPIPEIKPEQMDKAIKELERLSPVNIIFQDGGVVGYDAEQSALVFPTTMLKREVLARLPAEIVIATAEQCEPGIAQAPYMRKTAMAVSVEFCGRFSLPMPETAAAVLDRMDTHIPPGEERRALEEIREMAVTIGDTVEKALGLQRGQSAPQRDEAR